MDACEPRTMLMWFVTDICLTHVSEVNSILNGMKHWNAVIYAFHSKPAHNWTVTNMACRPYGSYWEYYTDIQLLFNSLLLTWRMGHPIFQWLAMIWPILIQIYSMCNNFWHKCSVWLIAQLYLYAVRYGSVTIGPEQPSSRRECVVMHAEMLESFSILSMIWSVFLQFTCYLGDALWI